MRKKGLRVCLIVVFTVINLLGIGCGLADNEGELHLYQGIPFEGSTREEVLQILLEKTGLLFDFANDSRIEGIVDFGYEWSLQVDFKGKTGIDRILLSSAQTARVEPEEFYERVQSDLLQFIDVEGQLTALYGEPDCRFFITTSSKKKYMFQSGTWDMEQMMSVCEEYRVFCSYSIWGNVALRTWIDSLNPRYAAKPLSRVMLYYHPKSDPVPAASIAQFPPSNSD